MYKQHEYKTNNLKKAVYFIFHCNQENGTSLKKLRMHTHKKISRFTANKKKIILIRNNISMSSNS